MGGGSQTLPATRLGIMLRVSSLPTVPDNERKAKYQEPDKPLRESCKYQPLPQTHVSVTKLARDEGRADDEDALGLDHGDGRLDWPLPGPIASRAIRH